jgi:hypothetical protein
MWSFSSNLCSDLLRTGGSTPTGAAEFLVIVTKGSSPRSHGLALD